MTSTVALPNTAEVSDPRQSETRREKQAAAGGQRCRPADGSAGSAHPEVAKWPESDGEEPDAHRSASLPVLYVALDE